MSLRRLGRSRKVELALAGLLVTATLAFVVYPLIRPPAASQAEVVEQATPPHHLTSRRHAIYRDIVDLQFDRRMGKLTQADYQQLSEESLRRAADLLAQGDAADAQLEAHVEREIEATRAALHGRERR